MPAYVKNPPTPVQVANMGEFAELYSTLPPLSAPQNDVPGLGDALGGSKSREGEPMENPGPLLDDLLHHTVDISLLEKQRVCVMYVCGISFLSPGRSLLQRIRAPQCCAWQQAGG